ncbi:hypothetical protein FB567DRAFT_96113 [Paraphoma chrysanthemicola]|uniref:Uncharacterized protein n=1 Tax=Paraphoma chrysanthemicola TaxID=798071 RepID=A0A8K0R455_9PLEO|nr:hypothetical protein FB567DRAFT_96113 [Paraphoma chrysanthemicola]
MSPSPFNVTVHPFSSPTPSSCAYERGPTSSRNALVYISGLTSGPHTTPQVEPLIRALEAARDLDYSFWEFRMRSSYTGFGYSSIANDVDDTAALVEYLKGLGKQKVVLVGSSTGCQALLAYASSQTSVPEVTAFILQAPTSDRETASLLMPPEFLAKSLAHAEDVIAMGKKDEIMPKALIPPIFNSPITAYRWHSLLAKGGDDDYFSSDLDAENLSRTFGKVSKPVLILPSEDDEMIPPSVDKEALLQRWIDAVPRGETSNLSGLNPGADHTLSGDGAQNWFADKVFRFLKTLE